VEFQLSPWVQLTATEMDSVVGQLKAREIQDQSPEGPDLQSKSLANLSPMCASGYGVPPLLFQAQATLLH
jgi:hypothetical protein